MILKCTRGCGQVTCKRHTFLIKGTEAPMGGWSWNQSAWGVGAQEQLHILYGRGELVEKTRLVKSKERLKNSV